MYIDIIPIYTKSHPASDSIILATYVIDIRFIYINKWFHPVAMHKLIGLLTCPPVGCVHRHFRLLPYISQIKTHSYTSEQ